MKKKQKTIMLSGRNYKIKDMGEGQPCLLLMHQNTQSQVPLSMLVEQIRDSYRLIILDITEYLPPEAEFVSDLQLNRLIDDLHLLCDIYWLKKVIVRSDYEPDLIQARFKEKLRERYQSDTDINQIKTLSLDLH